MTIQFNTDNHITASEKLTTPLIASIEDGLSRFSHQITRIEVYLADENGDKNTKNDKRCVLEARLEGRQPVAVTNYADTHEQAVEGAIIKLRSSLDSIIGRLNNH